MHRKGRAASFLASVTSEDEARLVAGLGVDIVDAKNPARGALGALPGDIVRAIRAAVPSDIPVSATVGDPCEDHERTEAAVRLMAATGVDIVKVGFWPGQAALVRHLARVPPTGVRLVGVLLVDRGLDLTLLEELRGAGFLGAMLDTSDKGAGPLLDRVAGHLLRDFVNGAHAAGLVAGLAGSLRVDHVAQLSRHNPDILGFRGGLCRLRDRAGTLDREAVRMVRHAISGEAEAGEPCEGAHAGAMAPGQPERAA